MPDSYDVLVLALISFCLLIITGVPAFGFSPMNNTPILLHDHNEFLNKDVFLRGIDVYCTIIKDLANTERLDTE